MNTPVAIVIPVYNAYEEARRCLDSVLASVPSGTRIIVVNDCSTDRQLNLWLDDTAAANPAITLLKNTENAGFVRAANRGMREAEMSDVLLLNSDTVVTPLFLERLAACASSSDDTGIVNPLSNNATICSVPLFREANPLPETLDEYAELVAESSFREYPEIPTAVGFCMYIKAEVFEAVGYFDEAFGRGFGEENDFCERAKKAGFRIRLADDAYVAHVGRASFGEEGWKLSEANTRLLNERYPEYESEVSDFSARNPLRKIQENVYYHTARSSSCPSALFIVHRNPFATDAGGTELAVADLVKALKLPRAVITYTEDAAIFADEVLNGETDQLFRHKFDISSPVKDCETEQQEVSDVFSEIIEDFDADFAHIHHLFNWPIKVWRVLKERNIPFFFTIHDFMCVCPNLNLLDYVNGQPCECRLTEGEVNACLEACRKIAGRSYSSTSLEFLEEWRREFGDMLDSAHTVFAPSMRALDIARGYYTIPDSRSAVIQNGFDPAGFFGPPEAGPALRAAVIGNISHIAKGAWNYLKIIEATRRENIEWHFFGPLDDAGFEEKLGRAGNRRNLHFHGRYDRQAIVSLLHDRKIDVAVFLSACEETYSLSFTESLCAGVLPLCLKRGAYTERLKALGLHELTAKDTESAAGILKRLSVDSSFLDNLKERIKGYRPFSPQESADAHKVHYPSLPDAPAHQVRPARTFEAYWNARKNAFSDSATRKAPLSPLSRYLKVTGACFAGSVSAFIPNWLLRRAVLPAWFEYLQLFDPAIPFPEVHYSQDMPRRSRFLRRSFRSTGLDPFVVLQPQLLETRLADCIRFRVKLQCEGRTRGQLYWAHKDENFSEAKSMVISFNGRPGKTQDVVVDLRQWPGNERWYSGIYIERLRFDPLDRPGTIRIEEIAVLKRR